MEDLTSAAGYYNQSSSSMMMMKQPEQEQLKCPRCDSSNTKFCYYNNYNLSQPRHFCKNCRRYWTKGGSLRNIPVGGGIRKITKRTSSSSSSNLKNQKPSSESGSGSDLKDEKKVTGQEMDPTRMLYGLPVGDSTSVSFSSLLVSDIYETEPGWISGMGLVSDSQKRDDDTWTDLTMKRVEMN